MTHIRVFFFFFFNKLAPHTVPDLCFEKGGPAVLWEYGPGRNRPHGNHRAQPQRQSVCTLTGPVRHPLLSIGPSPGLHQGCTGALVPVATFQSQARSAFCVCSSPKDGEARVKTAPQTCAAAPAPLPAEHLAGSQCCAHPIGQVGEDTGARCRESHFPPLRPTVHCRGSRWLPGALGALVQLGAALLAALP